MRVYIDVTGPDGKVVNWNLELTSPNRIRRQGWGPRRSGAGREGHLRRLRRQGRSRAAGRCCRSARPARNVTCSRRARRTPRRRPPKDGPSRLDDREAPYGAPALVVCVRPADRVRGAAARAEQEARPRRTGRSGAVRRDPASRRKPACCDHGPPPDRRAPGARRTSAPASDRSRSAATASSSRGCGTRRASCRRSTAPTATLVWVKPIGRAGDNDRGPGPRGTPTVDGDRLYVLTENGDLASLRVQDGAIAWQRNILQEFGGRNIDWLISESPLVDGNNVDRVARRPRRGDGGARQDDRQDGLGQQGTERPRRLLFSHRRRRAGRPHHHDAHRRGGRRRARVGRQADVAPSGRVQQHREHRDPRLFRQQGVLQLRLRHRRRAARRCARRTAKCARRRCTSRATCRTITAGSWS